MFELLNKKWSNSRVNFFYSNLKWNLSFWLKCEKIYKIVTYKVKQSDFYIEPNGKMQYKFKTIQKKRFLGYKYNGDIYIDNTGNVIKNREQWVKWRNKKLLK